MFLCTHVNTYTVKSVNKYHHRDLTKFGPCTQVVFIYRWSLYTGSITVNTDDHIHQEDLANVVLVNGGLWGCI